MQSPHRVRRESKEAWPWPLHMSYWCCQHCVLACGRLRAYSTWLGTRSWASAEFGSTQWISSDSGRDTRHYRVRCKHPAHVAFMALTAQCGRSEAAGAVESAAGNTDGRAACPPPLLASVCMRCVDMTSCACVCCRLCCSEERWAMPGGSLLSLLAAERGRLSAWLQVSQTVARETRAVSDLIIVRGCGKGLCYICIMHVQTST